MQIQCARAPDFECFRNIFQGKLHAEDREEIFKVLRVGIPSDARIVDYLAALDTGLYDQKAASLLSVASTWAYSDVDTLARMMRNRGIPNNQSVSVRLENDAILSDTTANVIQSRDGKVVILCFGGTLPTNFIQLLLDFSSRPDSFFSSGLVHGGIFRGFLLLWPLLSLLLEGALYGYKICDLAEADHLFHKCDTGFYPPTELQAEKRLPKVYEEQGPCQPVRPEPGAPTAPPPGSPTGPREAMQSLFITGHSLGGAMAVLTAALIHADSNLTPLKKKLRGVYTFGQPMVGDAVFARTFDPLFGKMLFRHIYRRDVVPHLPPRSMGDFIHFGQELKSTQSNWEMDDARAPQALLGLSALASGGASFLLDQFPLLGRVHLSYSIADHSPLNYLRTSLQSVPGSELLPA